MNKIIVFWQELKRRNVVRRNAVYAGAAFVILELVSIVVEPLRLPDWTLLLVIILLSIGFIVSIVLSWIYETNSEGRLEKTKALDREGLEEKTAESLTWKIASYISFVVIALLIILNIIPRTKRSVERIDQEKTIAVLPFQNLSNDSTQAYFCEAIREEILNHLDKVEVFSVRSRTSTDQYRDTDKNISTIGKELNVNYLVEGSIGFEENQIKIWIQLINASTDEHIWSEDFIREKRQIFAIQSEIAQTLAEELKTTLSPEEIEKIEHKPTENTDAYQAYIRGRYFANQPHYIPENWDQALRNYQEAVEIDSTFALAYGGLAKSHALYRYLRWDLSESRLEQADQAAENALKYGSDQPEVHLALGYYYLYAYRDQKQKEKHWNIAVKGLPNNTEIMVAKAAGLETQGKWEDANLLLQKAAELNPNDASIHSDLGTNFWWLRRFREADNAMNKAITLSPKEQWPYISKAYNMWAWKGPNQYSRNALKQIDTKNGWYLYMWFWQEAGEGNYEAALQLMSDTSSVWAVRNKAWARPKSLFSAYIYDHLENNDLARTNFQAAASILEKKVSEVPDDPRYHSSLGMAYAGLGLNENAKEEAEIAAKLLTVPEDAIYGSPAQLDVTIIYIMIGEMDLAMEQMEYLLSFPNYMSVAWIEWDFRLAPLKTHPGYQDLLLNYSVEQ